MNSPELDARQGKPFNRHAEAIRDALEPWDSMTRVTAEEPARA